MLQYNNTLFFIRNKICNYQNHQIIKYLYIVSFLFVYRRKGREFILLQKQKPLHPTYTCIILNYSSIQSLCSSQLFLLYLLSLSISYRSLFLLITSSTLFAKLRHWRVLSWWLMGNDDEATWKFVGRLFPVTWKIPWATRVVKSIARSKMLNRVSRSIDRFITGHAHPDDLCITSEPRFCIHASIPLS